MTDNVRGILAILASSAAFVLNDATIKLIAETLPAGQTLFLRGVLASIILFAIMTWVGQGRPHREMFDPKLLLRALFAAGSAIFIVLSLQRLPLATVNAVLMATPLMVVAGASILFKEHIGLQRAVATLLGFAGVVLVLQPFSTGGAAGTALLVVIIALLSTVSRDLITRAITMKTPPLFIAYVTSLLVMLVALVTGFGESWQLPSINTIILLLFASFCVSAAYAFGVIAMRTGEISVVAPFRYFQIPSSVGLGYLLWGDVPNALAAVGIATIAVAGLVLLIQERTTARAVYEKSKAT